MCVGLAEVRSRQLDFSGESAEQRLRYLETKPVPLVRSTAGELWMVDRHHRLRALVELDPEAMAVGYVALEVASDDRHVVLAELERRGWLYLYDGRGLGPLTPAALPTHLADLQDDPYRSLVWKLKKEGRIEPAPLIPFHEFRWGAWLRSRSLRVLLPRAGPARGPSPGGLPSRLPHGGVEGSGTGGLRLGPQSRLRGG
jgi:hypothetical protein